MIRARHLLLLAAIVAKAPAIAAERRFANIGFNHIVIETGDNVRIASGTYAITAVGPQFALDLLDIRQDGETLRITRRRGGWRWDPKPLAIVVVVPALTSLTLAGPGSVLAEPLVGPSINLQLSGPGGLAVRAIKATSLAVEVSGSGGLVVGDVAADLVDVNMSGTGTAVLAGRCTTLQSRLAATGDLNASGLACAAAHVSVPGSGSAGINASQQAEVDIAGSGHVVVSGGARCVGPTSNNGQLRCN
jgi:hypothetical protein